MRTVRLFDTMNQTATIEDTIFPHTSGFDFHFVIAEGEIEKAKQLLDACVSHIQANLGEVGFLIQHRLFDHPVGPWQSPMWFVEIATVARDSDRTSIDACSEEKMIGLQRFMKKTAAFLTQKVAQFEMGGSLFIHANEWPDNSEQTFERALHYDHSWLVLGEPVSLIDIWQQPGGLIAIQQSVNHLLEQDMNDEDIVAAIKQEFEQFATPQQLENRARMLIQAAHDKATYDNEQTFSTKP